MVTAGLSVGTLVNVTSRIATGGVPRLAFGRGLLVTLDDALSAGGTDKLRYYTNITEVNNDFDAGDALTAASVWFSADPIPQGLYIGRWATTDISTTLAGGTPSDAADFTATNYSLSINGVTVQNIDLSTPTTYAGIAGVIQTSIAGTTGFTGTTVTYSATPSPAFTITLPDARELDPPYLEAALTAAGVQVGTDLVPLLNMGQGVAVYRQGHDEEAVVDAVGEMLALATGGEPTAVMLAADAPLSAGTPAVDTIDALRGLAQASDFIFGMRETDSGALTANETTSKLALSFAAQEHHVAGVYTPSGHPEIALMAEMSAQNLNNPASIITPHAKPLPGVAATVISSTALDELVRKNANVYTFIAGQPSLYGGFTSRPGYWLDAVWSLLWLTNELELNIFNAIRGSRRMTNGILMNTLQQVMQVANRNGMLAAGGRLDAGTRGDVITTTGNADFDGTLIKGYTAWVDTSPTALDRTNRIGRFKVWAVFSPAIHRVFGDVVFTN